MRVAAVQPLDELRNRVDLVAADLEVADERESVVNRGHERNADRTTDVGSSGYGSIGQGRTVTGRLQLLEVGARVQAWDRSLPFKVPSGAK